MSQSPVVVSVGGSVVAGEQVKAAPVEALASTLDGIEAPLAIVVGGGAPTRRYIDAARELGLDEAGLDELGITVTRANARLLIAAFGDRAYPRPAENFDEALQALRTHDRVCMGGTHPGHTTDAVAAMTAERLGADRLVVVTNVDGVYTSDPKADPDAERLDELTFADLVDLTGAGREAGHSAVIDPLAAQIIQRSSIETRVVGGDDQANVADAVKGTDFDGSRVVAE